ncbi:hypothetical protein [Roseovarius azorensis]|nr:hypothetical protein [Roseovarius azorensis]
MIAISMAMQDFHAISGAALFFMTLTIVLFRRKTHAVSGRTARRS